MKLTKITTSFLLSLLIVVIIVVSSCSKDVPIIPPDGGSTVSKLDTTINVDLADAVITYQDSVSIRIPQGTVAGDVKLSISKLNDSSIPEDDEMEFPDVYEITLGDQHIFEKSLEITLKYDPEKLNEGKLRYKIGAAYYNETLQRWSLFQDVTVDTLQNNITINTNHLTKLSWYHLKYAYGYTDYITSPHFILYWTDGKVPTDTDYNSSLTNHKGTAPHYVQDILHYMEVARAVYQKEKLTVPTDTVNKTEIRVLELDPGEDGNTSYFGFVRISQNIQKDANFTQEELVKITCAHELLHFVQDYYYMWTFAGNVIKWWLEVTAVQADRIVWPGNSNFEAVKYADESLGVVLDRSWDDCNLDPNYYIAGGFLSYLTTFRGGAKLSIPEIIIETGKATDLSYFRTILNNHLKSKLSAFGIGQEYRDYLKWAFEHKGPIKISYLPPLSGSNSSYVVPVRLTESEPSWQENVTVQNLAMKMVKIISPESQGSTTFKIVCNSQDTQIEQFVYVTDKDKTTYKKYLIKGDTVKIVLDRKNQWIDILSCNVFKDDSGSFDLSVELVKAPAITSISPSTAKVGETVQIKGNNFGSSQDKGEVWFGLVKALATDIVSWIDNQIDVKVPEGAVSADVHVVTDGEESNDVSFTVKGEPIITDIIDHLYNRDFQGIHRFTLPNNTAHIIGQFFGEFPTTKKVLVNNIEVEAYNWSDTLVMFKLPEQPTGNITVKLVTSDGESNEFPYFSGLPVSYLNSAEPILLTAGFYIEYYNARAGKNYTKYLRIQPVENSKDKYSWSDRVLTVSLNSIENITGTATYTFSEDGLNLKKVEIEYSRDVYPGEIVHYTASSLPYSETNDWHGYESTFYQFGSCGEDLEQYTNTINGSINYVDDLREDIIGLDYSAGCAFNSVQLKLFFVN